MLPSRTRGRYFIFILFSLLVHFTVIVAVFWSLSDEKKQVKKDKTVTVQLKQKEEPKKEILKKEELKKAEAKKAQAKKAEAKKAEAKKAEAKKAEAKKAQAKKAEAKKAQAKKAEAKKAVAKEPAAPYRPYQSSVDVYSQKQKKNDALRAPNEMIKYGSMTILDDRQMKRAIIYTKGYDNKYQVRQYEGQIIKESLSNYEKQILNKHLTAEAEYIFSYHKPPKKDGKKYYGEISMLLDSNGNIAEITLKLPSGSDALDESVYNALVQAKSLKLPNDPLLRKAMVTAPLTLNYSDEEMID